MCGGAVARVWRCPQAVPTGGAHSGAVLRSRPVVSALGSGSMLRLSAGLLLCMAASPWCLALALPIASDHSDCSLGGARTGGAGPEDAATLLPVTNNRRVQASFEPPPIYVAVQVRQPKDRPWLAPVLRSTRVSNPSVPVLAFLDAALLAEDPLLGLRLARLRVELRVAQAYAAARAEALLGSAPGQPAPLSRFCAFADEARRMGAWRAGLTRTAAAAAPRPCGPPPCCAAQPSHSRRCPRLCVPRGAPRHAHPHPLARPAGHSRLLAWDARSALFTRLDTLLAGAPRDVALVSACGSPAPFLLVNDLAALEGLCAWLLAQSGQGGGGLDAADEGGTGGEAWPGKAVARREVFSHGAGSPCGRLQA